MNEVRTPAEQVLHTEQEPGVEAEIVQFEKVGIRGLTLLLTVLKEQVENANVSQDIETVGSSQDATEVAAAFERIRTWSQETFQVLQAVDQLYQARLNSVRVDLEGTTQIASVAEKLQLLGAAKDTFVKYLRTNNHQRAFAAVMSKDNVVLEQLTPLEQESIIRLFLHDLLGSRVFASVIQALDFFSEDTPIEMLAIVKPILVNSLQTLPKVLAEYSFDTEAPRPMTGEQLQQWLQAETTSEAGVRYSSSLEEYLQKKNPAIRVQVVHELALGYEQVELGISEQMLQILLDNCIANAGKAGATEVRVQCNASTEGVTVVLQDNGTGFPRLDAHKPDAQQAGISFVRAEITQGKSEWQTGATGTGIGLAQLQKYLEGKGGSLEAGNYLGMDDANHAVVICSIPVREAIDQ